MRFISCHLTIVMGSVTVRYFSCWKIESVTRRVPISINCPKGTRGSDARVTASRCLLIWSEGLYPVEPCIGLLFDVPYRICMLKSASCASAASASVTAAASIAASVIPVSIHIVCFNRALAPRM